MNIPIPQAQLQVSNCSEGSWNSWLQQSSCVQSQAGDDASVSSGSLCLTKTPKQPELYPQALPSLSGSWSEHPRECCDHKSPRGTQEPACLGMSSSCFLPSFLTLPIHAAGTWKLPQGDFARGVTETNPSLGLRQGYSRVNAGLEAGQGWVWLSALALSLHLQEQEGLTPAHPTAWRFGAFWGAPESWHSAKGVRSQVLQ